MFDFQNMRALEFWKNWRALWEIQIDILKIGDLSHICMPFKIGLLKKWNTSKFMAPTYLYIFNWPHYYIKLITKLTVFIYRLKRGIHLKKFKIISPKNNLITLIVYNLNLSGDNGIGKRRRIQELNMIPKLMSQEGVIIWRKWRGAIKFN